MFWLSFSGLALLVLIWLKSLMDVMKPDPCPPQWHLSPETSPAAFEGPWPTLSVIIPARNEASNLADCLSALFSAHWPGELQVVLVDDRSTDATPHIAAQFAERHPQLEIISAPELPVGWLGKPHALHHGAARATGEWLLFLDADVQICPEGLILLLTHTIAEQAVMSSAMGHLEVDSFWECVVQTRIGALIAGGNPLEEVNDPDHSRALAVGQCMLFQRSTYEDLGGHEAIRHSVLDDVDFAKHAKANSVPYRLFYGPGVFRCRMYRSLSEIWHGWSKNLFPALEYRVSATLIIATLLFISSILPFVLLAQKFFYLALGLPVESTFLWMELGICCLIFVVDGVGHANRGYSWYHWWTFPLGMILITLLFLNSAWRIGSGRGVNWKGRKVEAENV